MAFAPKAMAAVVLVALVWLTNWQPIMSVLGELRGVIGLHAAALAAKHGLNVEGELEFFLPAKPSPKDG